MIGNVPNGKSQLKEFIFEEDGKSITFLYLVQSIQVALSEVGCGWGFLKKTNLTSRQNVNDFLLFLSC